MTFYSIVVLDPNDFECMEKSIIQKIFCVSQSK